MRNFNSTKAASFCLAAIVAGFAASTSGAAQDASTLNKDCAAEIASYCKQVTPGRDRVAACLVAYEDKVSPRCRLTTYLSTGELDVRLQGLKGFAKVCSADILQYCSKVQQGGGRVYDCLKQNQATLTDDCRKSVPQFEKLLSD